MDFSQALNEYMNNAKTGNGDPTYKSSLSPNVDLFAKAGGVRSNNFYSDISINYDFYKRLFLDAINEDANTAVRNLLNIRDFRHDGKGERELFRELLVELSDKYPDTTIKLIDTGAVQELGRWDDLVFLYENTQSRAVKDTVLAVFTRELQSEDSLLPKWLPTNTRNKKQYAVAKKLAKDLGYVNFEYYRKDLSRMKKKLNLVETNLTERNYTAIDVSKLPGRAFQKYKTALFVNKEEEMKAFLDEVNAGTKKVKTTGITSNEILKPYTDQFRGWGDYDVEEVDKDQANLIKASWESLLENTKDAGNTLIMADTSGSMMGTPISVATSLAILFAQKMAGVFHGKFMTFSSEPTFINIPDNYSLAQKVQTVIEADWGGSTDIDAAFRAVLDTAVNTSASKEDIPQRIVIISDLQFNQYSFYEQKDTPHISRWKKNFEDAGYKLPDVVYWNVSTYDNEPAMATESGVALISGFTQGTLNAVLSGESITPVSVMMNALNKPEYDVVDRVVPKQ